MRNKIEAGLQKFHYYTRTSEGRNDLGRETAKNTLRALGALLVIGAVHSCLNIAEGRMGIQRQETQSRNEVGYLTHRVTPEDRNLFRIGLKYGMTPDYLACANGIEKDLIYVGQDLMIPVTPIPQCEYLNK